MYTNIPSQNTICPHNEPARLEPPRLHALGTLQVPTLCTEVLPCRDMSHVTRSHGLSERQAKVPRPAPTQYSQQHNLGEWGASMNECSMHALNSKLVNCRDRQPIKKWSVSGTPQTVITRYRKLKSGKTRVLQDGCGSRAVRLRQELGRKYLQDRKDER